MNHIAPKRYAFTLVELLVVIGIIALLISILMPSLSKARRAAQTVACLSNLRQLGTAMIMYANENKGAIVGSGNTSGRHIWQLVGGPGANLVTGLNINNIPNVNEPLDWAGPLARVMGLKDSSLYGTDGVARFQFYTNAPQFLCPSYVGMVASPASTGSGTDGGIVQAFSYNTALAFMNVANSQYAGTSSSDGLAGNVCLPGSPYWTAPAGYFPKITKVGNSSQKVFMADGARRTRPFAPAYVTEYRLSSSPKTLNTNESMYADYGPFCGTTRSYSRGGIPGNQTGMPTVDLRWLAFRHGTARQFAAKGLYRMNMVFFDGHAETMEDMAAANPSLWVPRGSLFSNPATNDGQGVGSTIVYADVRAKFNITPGWVSP